MPNVNYIPRKKALYISEKPKLMKEIQASNTMEVPKLEKIIVTMGENGIATDKSILNAVYDDLYTITGQKPIVTKAKKSIAAFKLRAGMPMGCKVTLRSNMMYEFIDRLVNIALPRVRDFRGIKKNQIEKSCLSLGLKEHVVFPEINYDKVDKVRGMNIVIVTTAKESSHTQSLLKIFGLPFID